MRETRWRVIMRLVAAAATPAFHVPTIVRIRPNAITAVAIPSTVSAVRSRCRTTFLSTILRSFTPTASLQLALVEVPYQVRPLGSVRVVRHHQDRLLVLPIQTLEQRQDLLRRLAVQIARRLVGHEDGRVGRDRAGDRDALLLTARELARVVVHAVAQPDQRERRLDVLAPLGFGERREQERQLDVLERREHRYEVVELEHEADVRGAPAGELRLAQLGDEIGRA